jgi:hypothetical protein
MQHRDDSFFTCKMRLAAKRYQVPNCIPNWPKFECLLNAKMPLRKINHVKYINMNPPSFDISLNELQ